MGLRDGVGADEVREGDETQQGCSVWFCRLCTVQGLPISGSALCFLDVVVLIHV